MEHHCCFDRRTTVMFIHVLCVVVLFGGASGFNLDKVNYLRFSGPRNSMFGFAVAGHREGGSSWVLVGAPSAQTAQPRVIQGGAVFRCSVRKDVCQEVPFDVSGDNRNSSGSYIDQKSHQWFGATLYSSGDGSAVVACAPRYIFKPVVSNPREDPVGTCYVARDHFQHFSEYSPCRTSEWGYHRQGSCQAGLAASISKDGKQLFIGAPGSRYWQGQVYSLASSASDSAVWPFPGQIYSQNLQRRPEVYSTGEGPATDDDSYLGYSVSVGNFAGDGTTSVAVGRPRGNQLSGKVLIYTWNLTLIYEILGDQLGSYFGYSLCAADIDGDGNDDLVVGTPLHTDLHNNEGKYETGRIYVFYQNEEYEVNHTRDGRNSKARFGLSLTNLGDLNKDGYEDIAVGAPYDGLGGRGAVYIYMGSKDGIMEKYSQVLYGDEFSTGLSTFGFSLSGGLDMDDNEYPDLVIGAYETDETFLLRARPVVKMKASVTFTTESKFITLENPNCTVGNTSAICTSLNICLEYSGIGTERSMEVEVKVDLDAAKPRNKRMFFRKNINKSTMTIPLNLVKNSLFCENIEVFIKANIRDKVTHLIAEMSYRLGKEGTTQTIYTSNSRRIARHLPPILDLTHELTVKDTLDIFKNCGKDNICIPDLKVEAATPVKTFLLGSREQFRLHVHVHNKGDDAFEATYYLRIPLGLSFININRTEEEKRSGFPVTCMPPVNQTQNILKCDIGNPLPNNKHVEFTVLMQPFYTEGLRSQYEFTMLVNSTHPEDNSTLYDNTYELMVPISIQTDFNIMGASEPHEVYWSAANYTKEEFEHEEDIGPSLTYIHAILNKGPADIVEANVFFMIPNETLTGDTLLYLLEQPVTTGPIRCEEVHANPLKLTLEHKDGVTFTENWKESSSSTSSLTSGGSSYVGSDGKIITSEYETSDHSTGYVGGGNQGSSDGHISGGSSSEHMASGGRGYVAEGSSGGYVGGGGRGYVAGGSSSSSEHMASGGRGYVAEGSSGGHVGGGGRGYVAGGSSSSSSEHTASGGRGYVAEGSSGGYVGGGGNGGRGGYVAGGSHGSDNVASGGSAGGEVWEEHGGSRRMYGLYGQTDEGGRVLHRDEGLISTSNNEGAFGQGMTSHGSQHFQNSSTWSNWTESHSGSDGTRTRTSSRYNATWSENDGPVHQFSNHSSSGWGSGEERDGEQRGESAYDSRYNGGGRVVYNSTSSHHSSTSSEGGSGSAGGYSRGAQYDGENSRGESEGSRGTFRHYSTDISGSVDGGSNRGYESESSRGTFRHYPTDSSGGIEGGSNRGYESESSQGSFRHYSTDSSGGIDGGSNRGYGSADSQGNFRHYSMDLSGGTDGGRASHSYSSGSRQWSGTDNVDDSRRTEDDGQYGNLGHSKVRHQHNWSHGGDNVDTVHHSSSGQGHYQAGDNVNVGNTDGHVIRHGSNRGSSSRTNIRQYTSDNWDSRTNDDSQYRGSNAGSWQYSSGQGDSSRAGGMQGASRESTRKYTTHFNWNGDDPDLSYAATGERVGGEGSNSHHYSSSSSRSNEWHRSMDSSPQTIEHDRRGQYSSQSSSTYSSSQEEDDDPGRLKHYQRFRREAVKVTLDDLLQCNATKCIRIACVMGPLIKNQEVRVELRTRVWIPTMKKLSSNSRVVRTSSLMAFEVTSLPYIGAPREPMIRKNEVFTDINLTDSPAKPEVVPLWVVVLSAVAGAIILLLIIYLLWMCGFFKRNRPSDAAEKEPLNRNGHYSAEDEAL